MRVMPERDHSLREMCPLHTVFWIFFCPWCTQVAKVPRILSISCTKFETESMTNSADGSRFVAIY